MSRSYTPNYFSLEEILMLQEKVPCTIECTIPRLGFLIPGNLNEDIIQGVNMELPLWLVQSFNAGRDQNRFIKMQMPKIFNEKTRSIFEADPTVINLFRMSPHFYEFGYLLSQINIRENDLVQSLVVQTFRQRFRLLLDWADNVMNEPNKIQALDLSERNLLKMGHRSRCLLDCWLTEGISQLKPAELVQNFRKRKLISHTSQ